MGGLKPSPTRRLPLDGLWQELLQFRHTVLPSEDRHCKPMRRTHKKKRPENQGAFGFADLGRRIQTGLQIRQPCDDARPDRHPTEPNRPEPVKSAQG